MPPRLPTRVSEAVQPLLNALPIERAMPRLVPKDSAAPELLKLADRVAAELKPELAAGIWLYVDELERSHEISQGIATPTGAFWHGIMHRREGDFSNAHYWFRRAGAHPAMEAVEGYEAHGFVDAVSLRYKENPAELVEMQRREWEMLFSWCAGQS